MQSLYKFALIIALAASCSTCCATDVLAKINLSSAGKQRHAAKDAHATVLWLIPISATPPLMQPKQFTLTQQDRQFHPHMLVVPTGSSVDFPNLDPLLHNVFSLFNGKRFDLGTYDTGAHRTVKFDREGVSYIFCNIHPEMGAIILTISTPYYAVSNASGLIVLHNVPPGRYRLSVWAEDVDASLLTSLSRVIEIPDRGEVQLGTIQLDRTSDTMANHKNKFGEPYAPAPKDPY